MAPVEHRAFARARIGRWAEFLEALGVKRGLQPVALPGMPRTRAWEVTSLSFASGLGTGPAAIEEWRRDLKDHLADSLRLAYSTLYRFLGPLWWLPGQGDHQDFSDECREIYAALVVDWLATAPKEMLRVTLTHDYYNETHSWSTPAGAFIRSATWLPADDPSPAGPIRKHHRPVDVWVSAGSDRYPPYLRQMAVAVHRAIERRQPEALGQLMRWGQLRILGSRDTLIEQLGFLAEQFAAGGIGRYYEPQLTNLYGATWRAVADRHAAEPAWPSAALPGFRVLARRGGELAAITPGAKDTPTIFVRDADDELAPSLVSTLDAALIDIRGVDRAKVGRATDALFGKNVTRLSQLRYRVRVDGRLLDEIEDGESLTAVCPWLRPMLAVAMEGLKGTDAWQLPADRTAVIDRLAHVSLHFAKAVGFEIDGVPVAAPADRSAYLFRASGEGSLVVALHAESITWSSLDDCLSAICEAIDLPSVVTSMRLLAWMVREAGEEVGEAVVDGDSINMLCRALRLEPNAEATVTSLVGAQIDARLPWFRAALHYAGGPVALAALHECELARGEDSAGLVSDIERLATEHGLSANDLLSTARRALSTAQFRDLLELEFGPFNESLAATGSEPVVHPDLHASQLANYVVEHEIAIIEALRNVAVNHLARLEPEPRYQQWRDSVRALAPDPAWLPAYYSVPEHALATRVQAWLASLGAPSLGSNPHHLAPLVEVRSKKERYPTQDIDKAWVSGNATDQHAKPGSDGYGYDFRLELDRRTWLVEVKASQGDSCRFEMGETEVREARRAARPRSRDKYVVIYVADPGNSSATRIDVLPNPMSDEGAGLIELLGEGIRYGFRRSRPS